ncbi:MAG: HTH-type transcriptional activator IlvY, partial [Actinomycetota bacterium]|nr:HTH-type transcriptional activator IlvY [Actinomycetota bacterium]
LARDRRHVALTTEGRRFQAYAGDVLERWAAFDSELHSVEELSGTLSVFCTVTASQSIVPAMLRRFREAYPAVHIALETGYAGNALAMLDSDAVDVTITALPPRLPRALAAQVLAITPLVFVAPTAQCPVSTALERRRIVWTELPMVLPPSGLARDYVEQWFRAQHLQATIYSEVASHEAILSLVSLGCGVGVVPRLVLDKSPLAADVRVVDIRPPLGDFQVGVCVRRRDLRTPLVGAFWTCVTDTA